MTGIESAGKDGMEADERMKTGDEGIESAGKDGTEADGEVMDV